MTGFELGNVLQDFSIGRMAELACLLEVTAPKPGNVHRAADFEDLTFIDFATSAIALGQSIDASRALSYGATVLNVAQRTWEMVGSNTNLGINLLITALAKVAFAGHELNPSAMDAFAATFTDEDADNVYQAIRIMNPGGLGDVESGDVKDQPIGSLVDAMQAASDRDLIAAQFGNGFREVFDSSMPAICDGRE